MDREYLLESALVRLLVAIGEPIPEGFECTPYEGILGDAVQEAQFALTKKEN